MGGDSKGLLAITISVLVFILWYSVIVPKFWPQEKVETPTTEEVSRTAVPDTAAASAAPTAAASEDTKTVAPQGDIAEEQTTLENDYFKAVFSNYGALPVSWELKKYTKIEGKIENLISMVPAKRLAEMPLSISFEKSSFAFPEEPRYRLVEKSESTLRYSWSSPKIAVEKIYTFGEHDYDLLMKVIVKNVGKGSISEQISTGWSAEFTKEKSSGILSFLKRPSDVKMPVYMLDGKVKRESAPAKISGEEIKTGTLFWTGIEDRYFLSAVAPRVRTPDLGLELARVGKNEGFYSGVLMPEATIAPGGSEEYAFTVFAGPKEMHILKAVGMELDKSIDYGWFTFIAIPILYVLKFLYGIVHNYGVAIILLTILIKILLHPISKKSMNSMKEMKKLQPQLKELKEKYAGNKERLNTEMMQLFKRHKVNPMSGCLPMVLQFPVYIALYRVLWNSIELYQAPFFWFYKDLSQADPYYITPVLLGVAMFLQQKLTPSATADPMQQKMMMMMPLMFCVFLAFLPVGLVIYILVNTVISVTQQWMNNNDIKLRDLLRGKFKFRASSIV